MSPASPGDNRPGEDPEPADAPLSPGGYESQRLDKWLWFARVIKTRTLAAGLVIDGRVRINSEKIAKPSHLVRLGDVLTIGVANRVRVLKVAGFGLRRGPATEAKSLFVDLTPPPPPRNEAARSGMMPQREPGSGRPSKRDRRQLQRFAADD